MVLVRTMRLPPPTMPPRTRLCSRSRRLPFAADAQSVSFDFANSSRRKSDISVASAGFDCNRADVTYSRTSEIADRENSASARSHAIDTSGGDGASGANSGPRSTRSTRCVGRGHVGVDNGRRHLENVCAGQNADWPAHWHKRSEGNRRPGDWWRQLYSHRQHPEYPLSAIRAFLV